MRLFRSIALSALALAFLQSAFAQTAPSGPYTDSCQNIEMKGNTLHAKCQSADGKWNAVELRNARNCADGVIDLNGVLSCQSGIIPPGSYLSTCTDFNLHGATLMASCRNEKGTDIAAEKLRNANLCTGDIANKNGSLKCVSLKNRQRRKTKRRTTKKKTRSAAYGRLSVAIKAEKSS